MISKPLSPSKIKDYIKAQESEKISKLIDQINNDLEVFSLIQSVDSGFQITIPKSTEENVINRVIEEYTTSGWNIGLKFDDVSKILIFKERIL